VTNLFAGGLRSPATVGAAPGAEGPCAGCLGADPGNRLEVAQRECAGADSGPPSATVLGCEAGGGKRIIKGRPFGVGFDRSHLNLQQGAPS
jgi:hypothetical protein